MKATYSTVSALLCVSASAICSFLLLIQPSGLNDLEALPSAVADMGSIRQGELTNVKYRLRNNGPGRVRILNVMTSCQCTKSHVENREIPQGGETTLILKYDSRDARGLAEAECVIMYDRPGDDGYRTLSVSAHGKINPDYLVTPEKLTFYDNKPAKLNIVIQRSSKPSLKVTRVTTDKTFFVAQLISSGAIDKHIIEIRFDPKKYYPAAGLGHAIIETTSEAQRILMIPLNVLETKHS